MMRKASLLIIGVFSLLGSLPLQATPLKFEIKSTVAFVYVMNAKGKPGPNGTGFFVGVRKMTEKDFYYNNFATAKHLLQVRNKNGKKQWRPSFFLRLNRKDGKHETVEIPIILSGKKKTVFTHADPNVDLAVIPMQPDPNKYDLKCVPDSMLTTREDFNELNIREGTGVFYTGLFTPYPGRKKNYPIVRFGQVALVTDEKIEWDNQLLDLYLIECTSIGGNSGSPVFFRLGQEDGRNTFVMNVRKIKLAGVMKGYFTDINLLHIAETAKISYIKSNSGIAAITPAYQLREILFSEELKTKRGL